MLLIPMAYSGWRAVARHPRRTARNRLSLGATAGYASPDDANHQEALNGTDHEDALGETSTANALGGTNHRLGG